MNKSRKVIIREREDLRCTTNVLETDVEQNAVFSTTGTVDRSFKSIRSLGELDQLSFPRLGHRLLNCSRGNLGANSWVLSLVIDEANMMRLLK